METYGEHSESIRTCEKWFQQLKRGNFNVKDKSVKIRNCRHDGPTQTTLSSKMINLNHALIEKQPEWAKVILLHNNALKSN